MNQQAQETEQTRWRKGLVISKRSRNDTEGIRERLEHKKNKKKERTLQDLTLSERAI